MKFSLRSIIDGAAGILKVFGKVLLGILLLVFPLGFLQIIIHKHWVWGLPFVLFMGVGVYFSIREYQEREIKTWQGIWSLCSILSIIISIFAFLSLVLNGFGAAHYEGFHPRVVNENSYVFGTLLGLYAWELFECIPAVRVNEALGLSSPLRRSGYVAGSLVLVFRVLIIFIVLDVFRKWWIARGKSKTTANIGEADQRWVVYYGPHSRAQVSGLGEAKRDPN